MILRYESTDRQGKVSAGKINRKQSFLCLNNYSEACLERLYCSVNMCHGTACLVSFRWVDEGQKNNLPSCLCVQECTPFAVIGSNTVVEARGQRVRGRLYPWGIVEGMFMCHLSVQLSSAHMRIRHSLKAITWIHSSFYIFLCAVENQSHCDFVKLRNMLIRSHMHDLKDVTCDVHYENYRAQCIQEMTRYV